MQKLIFCFFLCTAFHTCICAQKISGNLRFEPGKTYTVSMEIKNSITQQAAAQAIDFSVTGTVIHYYTAEEINSGIAFHHSMENLSFSFDGMGQKKAFNTGIKKDMDNAPGKQFAEVLSKKYDLVLDSIGTTVMTDPEKANPVKYDEHLIILNDLIKDLTAVAYPPAKGTASFFKVLPGYEIGVGDSWKDSVNAENQKSATINTLSGLTDSTIIITFTTTGISKEKSEMMGTEATTRMNYSGNGKIILDRQTGIIKEKTIVTDSNGNAEAMNASLPITGKTIVTIRVTKK
jgi:hypothetical protein